MRDAGIVGWGCGSSHAWCSVFTGLWGGMRWDGMESAGAAEVLDVRIGLLGILQSKILLHNPRPSVLSLQEF